MIKRTGGNEMTNRMPMGTSQPNLRLREDIQLEQSHATGNTYSCSHFVTGVNHSTICLWYMLVRAVIVNISTNAT